MAGRDKAVSGSGGNDISVLGTYDGCQQYQDTKNFQIAEIDAIFGGGVNIVPAAKQTRRVQIGQIITISTDDGNTIKSRQFWIDGFAETVPTPDPQVVGYYAPLIKPLIGLSVGDTVSIELDSGEVEVKILKIELPTRAHLTRHLLAA